MIPLACLILSAAAAPAPSAVYSGLPPDLKAATDAYDAAQLHGDRAALERVVADDYQLISSSGAVETKAQLVANYTAPGFKLNPYEITEPIQKVWRDGAILGGLTTLSGTDSGTAFSARLRFADVWRKDATGWKVVFTQVTRAPVNNK